MAQDNELNTMRNELERLQKQMRRSRKFVTTSFVILLLAMVFSFVYAFVQQVEAERNAALALEQFNLAKQARMEADRNAEEARKQQALAAENMAAAQRAIEECMKKKK